LWWLAVAGAPLGAHGAEREPAMSAEAAYRAIKDAWERSPPTGTDRNSGPAEDFFQARARDLYERGQDFWRDFPQEPRRWEVWMMMRTYVPFTREVVENGRRKTVPDGERQREWRDFYVRRVEEELLAAPDASAVAKATALDYLIQRGTNWRRTITTPEGQKMLAKMTAWFDRWQRDYPQSLSLINGVHAMAEVLDAADPARCERFLNELQARYSADTRRDRDIRAVVEGRMKRLHGQAYPVWIRLAALDGRFADTQEYRGKMVLFSLFPLAWEEQAEFLRGLHAKYHDRGLENIQVTGGDAMEIGAARRTALETALIADEKNYPWRIAWDQKGTFGAFARSLGINAYPSWLLISRDGRFVAQTTSQREIVTAIERELLIKPEPAAKAAPVALASAAPLHEAAETVMSDSARNYPLNFTAPVDAALQHQLESLDVRLRAKYGMAEKETAVGVLDLRTLRLALVRPDAIDYAASVPKIGILLAWFQSHPEAATSLDPATRHELGRMIKVSDNEMATKFSVPLGIPRVQEVLNAYEFYDTAHGGGLWFGKHYGKVGERIVDPVGGHSHGATVRQLVRYYLLLEQGKLVSPEASRVMREIFRSPEIPHLDDRFVKGLAGRGLEIRRKSGWWETWSHDTAVVTGPGRHYILVAMTHHAKGTEYLEEFAAAVDDALIGVPVRE